MCIYAIISNQVLDVILSCRFINISNCYFDSDCGVFQCGRQQVRRHRRFIDGGNAQGDGGDISSLGARRLTELQRLVRK